MPDTQTQQTIEYLLNELEEAGKRATPQRYAVCQALVEYGGHPTVAEVFERVRTIFPMISQATVYNTIDTLKEMGLIHQLDLANDEHAHYDLDLRPHINMVCTHCGKITDVHSETIETMLKEVSQHTGYRLCRYNALAVYGVCPECQAEAEAETRSCVFGDCPGGHIPPRSGCVRQDYLDMPVSGPRRRRRRGHA